MANSDKCPSCEEGTISWDRKSIAYRCGNCNFEVPFGLKERVPRYLTHGTKRLGSFIRYRVTDAETEQLESRLRALNDSIGASEEYKRRREHFEAKVNRERYRILKSWDNSFDPKWNDFEKGCLALRIAEVGDLPRSVVSEVLRERWPSAWVGMWIARMVNQHGYEVQTLWKKFDGEDAVKEGNKLNLDSIIGRISEKVGIEPYMVSTLLKYTNQWGGGSWTLWTVDKAKAYGLIVGQLWEQRKGKVKDDWSLCEVIEDISKNSGNAVDPYITLQILIARKDVDLNSNTAFITYSNYENANLALKLITEEGPKTAKAVSEKLDVCERVAHYALKTLKDKGIIDSYKERAQYFYLPNQEAQLKEAVPYLELEERIINYQEPYITIPDVQKIGQLCDVKSAQILNKLVTEGKLVKIDEVKPYLYVPLNEKGVEESIANALEHRYANILNALSIEGATLRQISGTIEPCNRNSTSKKLKLLEEHDLIYQKDGLFYSKDYKYSIAPPRFSFLSRRKALSNLGLRLQRPASKACNIYWF